MKKIFLITALIFGMISTSFANDIEFKKQSETDFQFNKEIDFESSNVVNYESMTKPPFIGNVFEQVAYCAQVQMDIKETYTPIFGPDRANSIALGAFMGCMGYL